MDNICLPLSSGMRRSWRTFPKLNAIKSILTFSSGIVAICPISGRDLALALELSVALIAGPCRVRSQRVVDALCAQTALQSIESGVGDRAREGGQEAHSCPPRSLGGCRLRVHER